MFRCFHMGWDNSHQYLVTNQERKTLDDRISFNPWAYRAIIQNTVLYNATLPQTFILRKLNPSGKNSRKRVLQLSFDRIFKKNQILSSFFFTFQRWFREKKVIDAIPGPYTDFILRFRNLKQNFVFSNDLKSIVFQITGNQNHLLSVQFLPSKPTAHAQV